MVRYLCLLMVLFSLPIMAVDQAPVVNIQTSMTSADMAAFGRITPYATETLGNVMVNPASIGGIPFYQMVVSTYQLSSAFDYRHFSFAFPYNDSVWSLSYGTNITSGFTKTLKSDGVIMDIGSFSSGFDVLHFSFAKKVNESFFLIDHFHYGFGLSLLSQLIDSSRRSPSYGLDVGVIATSLFDDFWLDRLDVGFSAINAVSTDLPKWSYEGQSSVAQLIERQLYAGAKFDLFNYMMSLHLGGYAQGFAFRDVMAGVEFNVSEGVFIRASGMYDMHLADEFVYQFGTGLRLNRVAGFGQSIYDMTIDYTYTMYPFPRVEDPSHTISMAFLGQSTDRRPVVLSPLKSYATIQSTADFHGSSDRNALIYVYNGDRLVGQLMANNSGKWRLDQLALSPGYNSITFRSKSGTNDLSKPSQPIVVHFDEDVPELSPSLEIIGNQVLIQISTNEPLKEARLVSGDSTVLFRKRTDTRYDVLIGLPEAMQSGQPLPDKMITYDIVAIDGIGNQAPTQSVSFFVEALFPTDQSVVYNDAISVLGYASPDVASISINGQPVEPDQNNGFSNSVQLNYGKQLVTVGVTTTNGQTLTYYARMLCIKRFSDIPKFAKYRRDIEFLATLGYVTGKDDGLFYPEEEMTRRDVTLAIAKQKNIIAKSLDFDPFLDIPKTDPDAGIISAAVDAGITYAFADGTFKPDDKVSVADAFKMLNNSGVIDSEDIVVSKKPIKRYEFALFFKQVRRYDQRVIYLMDWEQGYNLPN